MDGLVVEGEDCDSELAADGDIPVNVAGVEEPDAAVGFREERDAAVKVAGVKEPVAMVEGILGMRRAGNFGGIGCAAA